MKFLFILQIWDPSATNFHCPNAISEGNPAYSALGLAKTQETQVSQEEQLPDTFAF